MSTKNYLIVVLSIFFIPFFPPSHAIKSPPAASSSNTHQRAPHSPAQAANAAGPSHEEPLPAQNAVPQKPKAKHKWPSAASVRGLASRPFKLHATAMPHLTETNELTEEGLLAWIEGEHLLSPKLFQHRCLKVQQLMRLTSTGASVAETGSAADAIFFIMYDPRCLTAAKGSPRLSPIPPDDYKLIFVLKKFSSQADQEKEMRELHAVEESPQLRSFAKVGDAQYPVLKFNEKFYKYKDRNSQTQYFSLSHAAKGETLWHYIWSYIHEPEAVERRKILISALKAYGAFGRTLANFHLKFMTNPHCPFSAAKTGKNIKDCDTIAHQDLNPKNVFYHHPYIIFIDNATMASSLTHPSSTVQDVFFPLTMPAAWLMTMSHVSADQQKLAQEFLKYVYSQFLTSYFHQFKEANPEATPDYFSSIKSMAYFSIAAFVHPHAAWGHLVGDYTKVSLDSFVSTEETLQLAASPQ